MRYETTHPWIDFNLDLRSLDYHMWMILGEVESKCEHIAGVPLSPAVAERMHLLYLAKGAWATTAIEGNTLSEEDVRKRVNGDLLLPPSKEYLGQEIDNVVAGCNLITERLTSDEFPQLTTGLIIEFNQLVFDKLEVAPEVIPGQLRQHPVGVASYLAPPAEDCRYLLDALCEWLNGAAFRPPGNQIAFGVIRAVIAHLYIAWIHPFGDGNGRTARLLEVQILLAAGVPSPAAHLLSNHYNATRAVYFLRLDASSKTQTGVLEFIKYALQGFVDGLKEQLDLIRTQQWDVACRQSLYDAFPELPSETDKRRRDLALEITLWHGGEVIPHHVLRDMSGKTVRMYAGKTNRTIQRDLNILADMGLVAISKDGVRARRERILQFLPLRRVQREREDMVALKRANKKR